jgi:glycosyltransferase involved in cell wall biosynthesis
MNILMVNWSWYPTGGDWTYIDSVKKIYEAAGHKIIPFSMQNSSNIPNDYESYFIKNIDYNALNKNKSLINGFNTLIKATYSFEAKRKIKKMLDDYSIDIVQLNNITNSITPSIIPVIKEKGIPIVWRVLDYRLICPNAYLFTQGEVCEACINHKYYNCIKNKCKKKSILASSVAALCSYFYSIVPYYKFIDVFSFQSEFTRDMFIKFGFDKSRTSIIENPYDCTLIAPEYHNQGYFLYFGRIERVKGIYTILDAMKKIPEIKIKIVGDGSEKAQAEEYAQKLNLKNVEFLGSKWGHELIPILQNSKAVLVPSEWHEPSPYVVLQAFSYGKPVIASRMGGLNDLMVDNKNGLVFESTNVQQLCEKIETLENNDGLVKSLGMAARKHLENVHNPSRYYDFTIDLFTDLILRHNKS